MDILILMLSFMMVIIILCGLYSLAERKTLALLQLSMGPAIMLFGVFSPMFDGLKLFIKFNILLMNTDYLYLMLAIVLANTALYTMWFLMPLGYMPMMDTMFTMFLMMSMHAMHSTLTTFSMGMFIMYTSYCYIASMSALFFSMISEMCLLLLFLICNTINYFNLYSIKSILSEQLYTTNIFILNMWTLSMTMMMFYLDTARLPFDYMECESELVAGITTELSGILFCIFSLSEINHIMMASMMMNIIFFGGVLLTIKTTIMLMLMFMIPRSILCRMSMTNSYTFMTMYMYLTLFMYIIWYNMTKMMMITVI